MKKLIPMLVLVIALCSIAFASVTRTTGSSSITYTTTMGSSYSKAYWAIYEVVPAGCTVTAVSCSAGNQGCSYVSSDKSIRVVGYTQEAGGAMPTSITVTVTGSGSCTLNAGQYVESYNDGTSHLGASTALASTPTLSFSCPHEADTVPTCDGIKWAELTNYVTAWATADSVTYGHAITWGNLDQVITWWATGG